MKLTIAMSSALAFMIGILGCPFFLGLWWLMFAGGCVYSICQAAILINNDSPD